MKRASQSDAGIGRGAVFGLAVLFLIVLALVLKLSSNAAPAIEIQGKMKGIGLSTPIKLQVRDALVAVGDTRVGELLPEGEAVADRLAIRQHAFVGIGE